MTTSIVVQNPKPKRAHNLAIGALAYSAANLTSQVLNFVANFVIRRILVPEIMGIWNLTILVRDYLMAAGLGTSNGATRELPILRGQGEHAQEKRFRSVTLTTNLAEAALIGIGLIGYLIWQKDNFNQLEILSLASLIFIVASYRIQELYTVFFQGAQLYVPLSRAFLIGQVFSAALAALGTFLWGFKGLVAGTLAGELIRCPLTIFLGKKSGLSASLLWDKSVWKKLVSYGLAYRITDYPNVVFMRLDLVFVSKFFGFEGLGIYALAKSFFTQGSDITVRMGNVVFMRTLNQFGQGVHRGKIAEDMKRFILFQLMVSVPFVCWGIASFAPFLVRVAIPLYASAVPVMTMLILGSFFISQNNNLFAMWIAEKRLKTYGLSNVFGVVSTGLALAFSWFVLGHKNLLAVAAATVIGFYVYFAYMMFTAGRELWDTRTAFQVFGQVTLSATWTGVSLFLAASLFPVMGGWKADLVQTLFQALATMALLSPLFAVGLWVSGGGKYLYRSVLQPLRLRFQNG